MLLLFRKKNGAEIAKWIKAQARKIVRTQICTTCKGKVSNPWEATRDDPRGKLANQTMEAVSPLSSENKNNPVSVYRLESNRERYPMSISSLHAHEIHVSRYKNMRMQAHTCHIHIYIHKITCKSKNKRVCEKLFSCWEAGPTVKDICCTIWRSDPSTHVS